MEGETYKQMMIIQGKIKVLFACNVYEKHIETPEHIEEMYDVVLVFRGKTTDLKHSQELHVLQQCVYRQAVCV